MPCPPFIGEYKRTSQNSSDEEIDMLEVVALAKRLNFTFDEMKEISFVTLVNILLSNVEPDSKEASQKDIDSFF